MTSNPYSAPVEGHAGPLDYDYIDHTELTASVRTLYGLVAGLSLLAVFAGLLEVYLLLDFTRTPYTPAEAQQAAQLNDLRKLVIWFLTSLASLVAGFVAFKWLYRVNWNARALGAEEMKFSPSSMIWWYFIPLANLVVPYFALREIYRASIRSGGGNVHGPDGLASYWFCFVNANLADIAANLIYQSMNFDQPSVGFLFLAGGLSTLAYLFWAIACLNFRCLVQEIAYIQTSEARNLTTQETASPRSGPLFGTSVPTDPRPSDSQRSVKQRTTTQQEKTPEVSQAEPAKNAPGTPELHDCSSIESWLYRLAIVLTLLAIVAALYGLNEVRALLFEEQYDGSAFIFADTSLIYAHFFNAFLLPTVITLLVYLSSWIYWSIRNTQALGALGIPFGPWVLALFTLIPIVNLTIPFLGLYAICQYTQEPPLFGYRSATKSLIVFWLISVASSASVCLAIYFRMQSVVHPGENILYYASLTTVAASVIVIVWTSWLSWVIDEISWLQASFARKLSGSSG